MFLSHVIRWWEGRMTHFHFRRTNNEWRGIKWDFMFYSGNRWIEKSRGKMVSGLLMRHLWELICLRTRKMDGKFTSGIESSFVSDISLSPMLMDFSRWLTKVLSSISPLPIWFQIGDSTNGKNKIERNRMEWNRTSILCVASLLLECSADDGNEDQKGD